MIHYSTLIEPQELLPHLNDPDWAIFDCRFTLADPEKGRPDYLDAHVPRAMYAHLDEDLCGPIIPGVTGRHPLPAVPEFVNTLSRWGIDEHVQVVSYDAAGGAMAAARLWWMLQWLGHPKAAVLNGGWQGWQAGIFPTSQGMEERGPRKFHPVIRAELIMYAGEIEAARKDEIRRLIDVRTPERFRGENETMDPVAGRIPGAISAPYLDNLEPNGRFLPPEALQARYLALLGDIPAERAIFYCGSGVTAAQSVLALAHAGLGEAKLYAGSWSDWITDPARPVATG